MGRQLQPVGGVQGLLLAAEVEVRVDGDQEEEGVAQQNGDDVVLDFRGLHEPVEEDEDPG